MIRQKIVLGSKKKQKNKDTLVENNSRIKAFLIRSKPFLIILGIILVGYITFRLGMFYQIYRETEPELRNEDISVKEKVEAIKQIRDTKYLEGTITQLSANSIVLIGTDNTQYNINASDNLLILGDRGKALKLTQIPIGTKATITTSTIDGELEAKRIKIEN